MALATGGTLPTPAAPGSLRPAPAAARWWQRCAAPRPPSAPSLAVPQPRRRDCRCRLAPARCRHARRSRRISCRRAREDWRPNASLVSFLRAVRGAMRVPIPVRGPRNPNQPPAPVPPSDASGARYTTGNELRGVLVSIVGAAYSSPRTVPAPAAWPACGRSPLGGAYATGLLFA
jgi:hypothetical protein